jgi:membrane-associated phospholipid phosphatase
VSNFLLIIIYLVLFATPAMAGDNLFNSTAAIREETLRLGDEALEVVKTPFDTEHYGMIGTLAVAGAVGVTYIFDNDIRDKVQGNKNGTLNWATDAGNILGTPLLHLGVAAAVYGGGVLAESPRLRETGEMLGEAALLADATTFVLKEAVGRARPFAGGEKGNFRPFQFKTDYDSFPSMHTASSFAMASVLAGTSEKISVKVLSYAAAAFVGFSRIYQDKHWTSDVVISAAIGELCGRVVTSLHAGKSKFMLAPQVSGNSAGLSLLARW